MTRKPKKVVDLGHCRIRRLDRFNYVLEEKMIPKPGVKNQEPYWDNLGYYPKLEYMIWPILNKDVKGPESDSVLKCLEEIKAQLKEAQVEIVEKLNKLLEEKE